MSTPYLLRLLCLSFASFFLVYLALALLSIAAAPAAIRVAKRTTPLGATRLLLFLRLLTERDELLASLQKKGYRRVFSGSWARYAWGKFVTLTGDQLFDAVRAAIESIHELPGLSGTGKLLFNRATLKIYDRPTLRAVVQAIHEMDLASHNGHDLKGDMYEYLLSKLQLSGTNGQFRTPRCVDRSLDARQKIGIRIVVNDTRL